MKEIITAIVIISLFAFGYIFGRLSYAHVCTSCNENLDCKPYRNQVLTDDDLSKGIYEVGFMEHGAFGNSILIEPTYFTLEKINPKDWDKNLYFTGDGWSCDKTKAMKGQTRCELNNAYLHYQAETTN